MANLIEFCQTQNKLNAKLKLQPKQFDRVAAGFQLTYKKWRCDSLDPSSDSDSDS